MSIRLIAQELYRLHCMLADLEKQLESAPLSEKERLETELRGTRSDYRRVRQALEGHKQG